MSAGGLAALSCPAKARRCGGCPLLEVPYPEQLRQKQELVQRLLGRFGPVEPILGMEQPLHYRNKVIATFTSVRGSLDCGIYEESSHRVVPARDCLLQDSRLNEIVQAVLAAARRCRLSAYDEDRGSGLLRHMVLRRGVRTGQVSVTLVTPTSFFPGSRNLVHLLTAQCPDIVTIVQNINPRRTSAVLGSTEKLLFGKGYIEDRLCGKQFAIAPRAFYQINPVQTERLYETALDFAGLTGTERIIDAYCGIGTIALAAADRAAAVLGVELNSDAVKSARRNAARNRAKNAKFLCGDAGALMRRMAQDKETADLVFFDPPREGASREFLDALIRLSPQRAVYISCNPETQARDLALLERGGYHAARIRPVDLFPHTRHVETVVLLSKGEIDSKKVRVEFSLEDMDMSGFQKGATYEQIKAYVLEHTGLKVSSLYISQIKRKCGLDVGHNYNLSKKEDAKVPQCPPEKEVAIREAFNYFGML